MVCGVVVKTGISAESGHFQADNGCDERADEEDAGECDRLRVAADERLSRHAFLIFCHHR